MSRVRATRTRQLVPESDLPDRYQIPWRPTFVAQALEYCRPDMTILDVGGGDNPTLSPETRPAGSVYIGLDPDANELAKGEYDRRIVDGASQPRPELIAVVDLILSWNTFEHVPDVPKAMALFHSYLKPGGILLSRFAGRWAVFAIGSRLLPHAVRVRLLDRLIGSAPEDHPLYRGAGYFAFSRNVQQVYLRYESFAMRHPHLATHYNVRAVR